MDIEYEEERNSIRNISNNFINDYESDSFNKMIISMKMNVNIIMMKIIITNQY